MVLDYNPPHGYICKYLTDILRVKQNIGFTTSADNTINSPEKVVTNIEQMDHDFPKLCSLTFKVFLVSLVLTHILRFNE